MSSDDLLRSRANAAAQATDVTDIALAQSEDTLYALLAANLLDGGAADHRTRSAFDTDDLMRSEATVQLGRRVFARWSRALHDFLCTPGAEDQQLRERLLNAIFARDGGGVAIVSGGLVAAFGLSPGVAAIVATLVVKLVVAPAQGELCEAWGQSLARGRTATP